AHSAMSRLAVISGKTGTAQVRSAKWGAATGKFGDHAWFVAYAPADAPQVAMAVFVEHGGHGGSTAAPIARRAIEAYLVKNENK
ncbi:MAG: penicillin-binding transpeptidase domain-containing protein, partial [Thermodesulfovibrionales bacterium]|nr:penicillin-binding transpeptidase domain-containing protein [Thermodesulfovibrionales bacterium]